MRIQLQTQGFDLTDGIDAHVRKKIKRYLSSMDDEIISVDAFLGDINGPKGGEDKKALIAVHMAGRPAIRFEAIHADLYAAISVAARGAGRTAKRTLRKGKHLKKSKLRELRYFQGELQEPAPTELQAV
jgi:ribosomal subunit interface protein